MKKNKWFLPWLCLACLIMSAELKAQLSVVTSGGNVSCNGGCDGYASASVTGGTTPYTYQWNTSPVQTTATATGLCAGSYTVTVFDAVPDTAIAPVTINQPPLLIASMSSVGETCWLCCNGSASVTVFGGTTPYTYLWNDSLAQTTATATGLCYGNYCVTVTDMNGCTESGCVWVDTSGCTLFVSTTSTDVTTCGGSDGSATASVSSGNPPYTYSWNTSPVQTGITATGLAAGTYTVNVTDSTGCISTSSAVVNETGGFIVTLTSIGETCWSCCNGSATVTPSGGTTPYTYTWNDSLAQTTATATGLCYGNYCVTVTDMNGCNVSGCVWLDSMGCGLFVSTTSTDVTTCGGSDGTATANATGGVLPYTYSWNTTPAQTDSTATGLPAGTYIVTVNDSTGCILAPITVVNDPWLLFVSLSSTDETCTLCCDGSATVTASGGTPTYTYSWNTIPVQTNATATGLCAGNYCVVVTDANACTVDSCLIVADSALCSTLALTTTSTNETSCGWCDGTATANPSGGAPPYTYLWNPWGMVTQSITECPGTYMVTVTDANGCSVTNNVTINGSLAVTITTVDDCSGLCDGSATAIVTGGPTPPYFYQWNDSLSQTTATATGLCAGAYTLQVWADSCFFTTTVIIGISNCGPNLIKGSVFDDINANCIVDSTDFSLPGWMVRADPGPVYAIADNSGNYRLYLDSGSFTVGLIDIDPLRNQVCPLAPTTYSLNLGADPDTVSNINFGVQPIVYCPDMSVDISSWVVRPCFNTSYYVNYCNHGTIAATNATIEVELDSNISYLSGSGNLISQIGNILTFGIGTVNPGQCGSFYLYVYVTCNMSLVGSTMCVEAHVFPDSSCFPADSAWDKSSVEVVGSCTGDSLACFTITNTGDPGEGDMQGTSEYRIYENNMLVYTGSFQIDGGNGLMICWPANGNTIRLEADQRSGHPGSSHPQDNVELCGGPPFITGQIILVPEDDENDFVEIDCHVATGSYDPNEKQVKPEGLTQYKYIDSTDVLEYVIHFQNTGTDTAFKVVIRDTLSANLDITTIQPGAGSHPYTLDIFGSDVLQWTFDNILLPDSNVNESGSNGFVKFKINQKQGNTKGTVIENNAGIVFDFNEPVITNTVFNTIGNIDSVVTPVGLSKVYDKEISVSVYPNPFNSITTFEIKGKNGHFTFELYNIIGGKVKEVSDITDKKFIISRENMPGGIYIYKINSDIGLIGAGKLVIN